MQNAFIYNVHHNANVSLMAFKMFFSSILIYNITSIFIRGISLEWQHRELTQNNQFMKIFVETSDQQQWQVWSAVNTRNKNSNICTNGGQYLACCLSAVSITTCTSHHWCWDWPQTLINHWWKKKVSHFLSVKLYTAYKR